MISAQTCLSVLCLISAFLYYWNIGTFMETSSLTTSVLNNTYDYIIIGGGTAGSVLAARLSEDANATVLLLEAGGCYTENSLYHIPSAPGRLMHTKADWAFYSEPEEYCCQGLQNRRSFWPSGRVLGGSSVLNMMVYTRGMARDYDKWATLGCAGWSFKDVIPYFLKSEDILIDELKMSKYHNKGGPLAVSDSKITDLQQYYIEAGIEAGFEMKDSNEMMGEGISKGQMTIRNGVRSSSGLEFLGRAIGRRNLHVSVESFVTKIGLENKKAVGVYVIKDNKKRFISSRKEVIVSAGAINSPKLLMHSGIGPAKVLNDLRIDSVEDLPVGDNLQNHFVLIFNTKINQSLSITADKSRGWKTLLEYYMFGSGYMSVPGVEANLFACSNGSGSRDCVPDLQIMFFSTSFFNFINARADIFKEYTKEAQNPEGFFMVVAILNPKSKGRITVMSKDPFDSPKIETNFLSSDDDVATLLRGARLAEKLLETDTMKNIGASVENMRLEFCAEHKFRSDDYWRCVIRQVGAGINHYSGTCKMGSADDPTAVVDPQLRVRGIQNLRVVDASIMPFIVSGNTYAPVIMIAEKAADMVSGKYTVNEFRLTQ